MRYSDANDVSGIHHQISKMLLFNPYLQGVQSLLLVDLSVDRVYA